jgi:multidrug transporter EmrE-like cation transporter
MKNILLILMSVFLNASAQLLMRKGMLKVGEVATDFSALVKALPSMAMNIFLWLSLLCYGISILTWMMVLSKVEVSFAYAFLSLGFVFVTIIGYFVFNEHITPIRIIGIALICFGVFFVSKS